MPFQTRAAMVGGCLSFLSFPSARAFLSLLLTREGGRVVVEIPSRPFWWLAVDVDGDDTPDALKFAKNKPAGKKMSGGGHDGTTAGKNAYIQKTAETLNSGGYYAEMSKGIAHLMIKYYQVPHVADEEKVKRVLGPSKKIEWLGQHPEGRYPDYNGWYVREISGQRELKIMLGNPN